MRRQRYVNVSITNSSPPTRPTVARREAHRKKVAPTVAVCIVYGRFVVSRGLTNRSQSRRVVVLSNLFNKALSSERKKENLCHYVWSPPPRGLCRAFFYNKAPTDFDAHCLKTTQRTKRREVFDWWSLQVAHEIMCWFMGFWRGCAVNPFK